MRQRPVSWSWWRLGGTITVVESNWEGGLRGLETLVSSMRGGGLSGCSYQARGASPVVVLGPAHAAEVAAAGFGRKAVSAEMQQRATAGVETVSPHTFARNRSARAR